MAFKDILKKRRKELCLSNRGLALMLDIDFNAMQRYEKGGLPKSKRNIDILKKFLGNDIEKVIEEERRLKKEESCKKISKSRKKFFNNKNNEVIENKDVFEKLAKKEKCKNGNCLLNCEGKYCRSPIRIYEPEKFTCTGKDKIVKETKTIKKYKSILTDKNRCNVRS